MPDLTPIEKLQPCLLDRLTDDEPGKQEENRQQRIISLQKYKRGVQRDLEWLFNAQAYLCTPGLESFNLKDYPEAYRSVINFGIRQMFGVTAPNIERMQAELEDALKTFEPRINSSGLVLRADLNRNLVSFEVEGELWANPLPEHLYLKSVVDLETGQCLMGDSPHG